ncbi:MAG: hypothetical protein SFV51_05735 [Bryobacteraceae bacterium]|nr:hypothetical protein [Bryobacteraceae bacterium]
MTRRQLLAFSAGSAFAMPPAARFSGITMMPEWIQAEGIDGVLKNLVDRAKVTAVATSPYVMEPADDKTGSREPPIDAGAGSVRLLDRPLFGKRDLFVRTAPSFEPDLRLYRGLRYQPSKTGDLTRRQGPIVKDFLREAKRRGLKTYLQVQAAIPPGYRVQFGGPAPEDAPRLPDGRIPPRRLANNGSLASPAIRDYTCALLRDLAQAYPEVDGFRVDWPEYPPYFLDDAFLDFSDHAQAAAQRHGMDFDRLKAEALRVYRMLHGGLTESALKAPFPAMADLVKLKALLVEDLLKAFRAALPKDKELMPNAFPPPLSLISGMDFARVAPLASAFSVKLYTMHWPMILRFWGDALKQANPNVSESAIVSGVGHWLQLRGLPGVGKLADLRYPEPEEAHPVSDAVMTAKIRAAQKQAGRTPVITLAHGYGPLSDFKRRLKVAYDAAGRRVWVNRYGYLSDAKLDAMGTLA